MSLYKYEVFERVAEKGSFISAARSMNLTPSAVSHAVSHLEEEFGFLLFIRSRKGVELTDNGKAVLPKIKEVLERNKELNDLVGNIVNKGAETVKIGVLHSLAHAVMPSVISKTKEDRPELSFRLYKCGFAEMAELLRDNTIDIAVGTDKLVMNIYGFVPLREIPILLAAPKGTYPDDKRTVTIGELKKEQIYISKEAVDYEVGEYLRKSGIQVKEYIDDDDDQMMLALVEEGIGKAMVWKVADHRDELNIDLLEIEPALYSRIGIIIPNTGLLSPAAAAVAEEMKTLYR